jgi:hypothetical protein
MKRLSRSSVLRHVGLSSAVAVTMLASGVGVAGAATTAWRPAKAPVALGSRDAATNAPPMPPGGPRGIGGGVKVGRFVGAQGTFGSSPKTNHAATVGIVAPELGTVLPSRDGPDPETGAIGGGPFARGPPLSQDDLNAKGTDTE